MTTITKKVKLRDFFGVLSKEEGERLEENIKKLRKKHMVKRKERIKCISIA